MINESYPRTRTSLREDFKQLGLKKGMTVIVHSSLRKIGWVCGGPVAVVQALMDVITEEGNLVMPTQSVDYSDPSEWENPPVPQDWWQTIRDEMPAYEPSITPTFSMGAIVDAFRSFPGVIRSGHPTVSFAAWGKDKEILMENHALDEGFGESSPLAGIYNRDGYVLLIGVGYGSNTSMHLAEYRIPGQKGLETGSPVMESGQRVWKTYKKIETREELFDQIGHEFESHHGSEVNKGLAGSAETRLIRQKPLVDFTEKWFLESLNSQITM
ncbi:AAC(3) family N-acetyltransferase [Fictibacillus sp. WQ 8-8]|uniref:aminoglycoside N(3)-acetyltransferase n=1 Tax=Fictibacillus sp. WQ 8-8 TaxID=2938788 RepID=UPI00210A8EC0|nr:AAC(3) family N-acetyltransferase [Fictibacillus sp. WQ 8-8]MCQ6267473.1 AAC(3) family N-acetyltransferase [Fictibacillus sp. WQ 8-8]